MDAAGDVYAASFLGQVVELPAGSATTKTLPFTGLSAPFGVAVGAAGDVYVTDFGLSEALVLPAGSATQVTVPFTGLDEPEGMAVNAAGDVYVADVGSEQVLELSGFSPAGPRLSVTSTSLPNATGGAAYSATLTAVGGTPPYSWKISSGSLPPGLSLNDSAGLISGTPRVAGGYDFTVQVSDSHGDTAAQPLSITVSGPAISKVQPDHGPGSGGTPVRIDGTGLACRATHTSCRVLVHFGTHRALVLWVSPDQIWVLSPAGHGTVRVTVTAGHVASAATAADTFTYQRI